MPTLATTTNFSLRYPTAANDGADFAAGVADLAFDTDAALIALASTWTTLIAQTGWTASSSSTSVPGFRTDTATVVRLRGSFRNSSGGSLPAGTPVTGIPSGKRPPASVFVAAVQMTAIDGSGTPSLCGVWIDASGGITLQNAVASGSSVCLDSITYSTA